MSLSTEIPKVENFEFSSTDRLGIFASVVCMIHCVFLPVIAMTLPLVLPVIESSYFHIVMLLLIVPVTIIAVLNGYKKHGLKQTIVTATMGILFISIGLSMHDYGPWLESIFTSLGGIFLIWTHVTNIRKCHCCKTHAINCD